MNMIMQLELEISEVILVSGEVLFGSLGITTSAAQLQLVSQLMDGLNFGVYPMNDLLVSVGVSLQIFLDPIDQPVGTLDPYVDAGVGLSQHTSDHQSDNKDELH